MILGVTGTQKGWTDQQATMFRLLLPHLRFTRFHHGGCVGVDDHAANAVYEHRRELLSTHPAERFITIVLHPASGVHPSKVSDFGMNNVVVPSNTPLERNKELVSYVDLLIVVPCQDEEVVRSGTWATYRYAIKAKKTTLIIWPKGQVTVTHATHRRKTIKGVLQDLRKCGITLR